MAQGGNVMPRSQMGPALRAQCEYRLSRPRGKGETVRRPCCQESHLLCHPTRLPGSAKSARSFGRNRLTPQWPAWIFRTWWYRRRRRNAWLSHLDSAAVYWRQAVPACLQTDSLPGNVGPLMGMGVICQTSVRWARPEIHKLACNGCRRRKNSARPDR